MSLKRTTYLPIASIVIVIVILAVLFGISSFRDIERGRQQVSDVLDRQARLVAASVGAGVRASLVAPHWDRARLAFMLEEAAADDDIAHLAILDVDGRIVEHSDPSLVGRTWTGLDSIDPTAPGPHVARRIIERGGRTIHEFAVVLLPFGRRGPGPASGPRRRRMPHGLPDLDVARERLSELLGRELTPEEPLGIVLVVGLDSTDLDAAFLASRNHTFAMSGILLLVGAVATYFLFLVANYRSVRTALANMRSYTTNVIESMGSGLVSVDPDARVVTVNSRARSLLGLSSHDIAGKSVDDVLSFDADAARAAVYGVMSGASDALETEATIVGRDGAAIPVALAVSSMRDEEGERSGTVVIFQDLREIEALKEEVERERHLASLGRLAAGVAHEVRNPLSSLKGFAQFLRSKFAPGSEEERYADIMIEEVERLDRVVQELLDFAKPARPDRRASGTNDIIEEALALVTDDALYKNVTIVREFGEGLPPVFVDPDQIKQALLNVLLNAIEAMPDGGTLTVATGVEDGAPADCVTLAVADTGSGIAPGEIEKLYEPFYTTKSGGTGLGLTVVSRVVEQNGGHIGVSSAAGEGTTFSLRLPVAAARPTAESAGEES